MKLYDYDTHEFIRDATPEEARMSADNEYGDDGLVLLDWRMHGGGHGEDFRRCYVDE